MIAWALLQTLIFAMPAAALWPWLRASTSVSSAERLVASVGLGLALSSTIFFLWRVAGGGPEGYVVFDALLWFALAYCGTRQRALPQATPRHRAGSLLLPGAIAIVLVALAALLLREWIRAIPYGAWDAWAMWNLKARFLAANSGDWRNLFDVVEAHADYPLLLSGAVGRAWALLGATPIEAPITISLLFFFATTAIVTMSLRATRSTTTAIVGLAFMTVPMFIRIGGTQMADMPLAFFTGLAVTLLAGTDPPPRQIALAGLSAGCAAWTKNEGLVVAAALPAIYVCISLRAGGSSAVRRIAPWLAAGLLPMLLLVAAFKLLLAPGSAFVAGLLSTTSLHNWHDLHRVTFVARYMIGQSLRWGGWPVGGPLALLTLFVALPRRVSPRRDPAVATAGLLLLVQCFVFFCTYVMTPEPLAWHLQTSWSRLVAQMWPTAVWWACSTRNG